MFFTIIAILYFWKFELRDKIAKRMERGPTSTLNNVAFLCAGVIALWLAIRKSGLTVYNGLFTEGYGYHTRDVFDIIAYILTANLCFTLMTTFSKLKETRHLVYVGIRAAIIGFLTFLPRYGDHNLIAAFGGGTLGIQGYMFVLSGILISLIVFTIVGHFIKPEEGAGENSTQ